MLGNSPFIFRFMPSRSPSRLRPSVLLTPPRLRHPPPSPPVPPLVPRLVPTPGHLHPLPPLVPRRAPTVLPLSSPRPVSPPRRSLLSASCLPEHEPGWALPALGLPMDDGVGRRSLFWSARACSRHSRQALSYILRVGDRRLTYLGPSNTSP